MSLTNTGQVDETSVPGGVSDVCLCDVSKLSEEDKLGPDEARDASHHARQLQTMTSTMGKYCNTKITNYINIAKPSKLITIIQQ